MAAALDGIKVLDLLRIIAGPWCNMGLAYEQLSAVNPRLIHCSISGYGRNTPFADRAGYDFVMQAETGMMSITGETDGDPMRLGVAFVDLATGANAIQAILAALFAR